MIIKELDRKLGEALQTFSEEIQSNISCANDPRETLNYYDYEQLARQVFYMVDDFRANIIKYLESQAKWLYKRLILYNSINSNAVEWPTTALKGYGNGFIPLKDKTA